MIRITRPIASLVKQNCRLPETFLNFLSIPLSDCLAKIGGRCYQTQSSSGHLDKDRSRRVHKAIGHLSSPVDGRHVIVLDDMIDTGHTIEFALEVSHEFFVVLNSFELRTSVSASNEPF